MKMNFSFFCCWRSAYLPKMPGPSCLGISLIVFTNHSA